jgi:hypothetical protein
MSGWDNFRVTGWIAPSELGEAKVDVVTPTGLSAFLGGVKADKPLTRLFVKGHGMVMSDSHDEYRDHAYAIRRAKGRVLVHGLGLGCFLKAILSKPEVSHVDVVELSQDVIDLIGPYYDRSFGTGRVTFHQGDAYDFRFPKGTRWDVAWHDIWTDRCEDDLAGHARLNRRYARAADWQGCWAHEELLSYRRRSYA